MCELPTCRIIVAGRLGAGIVEAGCCADTFSLLPSDSVPDAVLEAISNGLCSCDAESWTVSRWSCEYDRFAK